MPVRPEALALVNQVNKALGEEAIVMGKDIRVTKRFPSGSLSLDVALGGGWPANQPIEVLGMESHGKTAVVLKTIAANQAADPDFTVYWIAAEPYDAEQAEKLGVDNDRVIVHSTQAMEEAFESMLKAAESKAVDCLVCDSYPALIADEEAAKAMDEHVMTVGARLMGKYFRKHGKAGRRSLTEEDHDLLGPIIINQWRDAVGQFSPRGTPKTSPGGKAKNFAYYVRAEVTRDGFIEEKVPGKDLKIKVGQVIKVKTIKNKSSAPQQVAAMDFYFRDANILGFKRGDYDVAKEILTMGLLFDVIERKGAYFQFDNGQYGEDGKPLYRWQGKEPMLKAIYSDLDLRQAVHTEVLERAKNPHYVDMVNDEKAAEAATAGEKRVRRKK